MLTTNVGITFATHYCGGKAVKTSISLGQDDLDCGMSNMDTPCKDQPKSPTIKRKSCCENQYTQISIDDDYNQTAVETLNVDFKFIAVFITSYINFYSFNNTKKPEYLAYSPPLLDHDVQVMNQTFLI